MKLEITQGGVFDATGEQIEVGTEISVKGDEIPASLVNKCRVIAEKPAKAVAVTNPAKAD